MKKFHNAHYWLIIPFAIAFLGFYFTYWSRLGEALFHQHLHGMTATVWYVLIIVQPLLYRQSNLVLHRIFGVIGIFLAGGVVFSAMQIIPNNLTLENISDNLRYSFVFGDFVSLAGFSFAVIMAVIKKNDLDLHARYMISTVFWVMLPALGRLIYFPLVISYGFPPPIAFNECVYIACILIILALSVLLWLDYKKERRFYKPYWLVTMATGFMLISWDYFGEAEWWIRFCHVILK